MHGKKQNIYPLSLRSNQGVKVTSLKHDAEQPVGKQHPKKSKVRSSRFVSRMVVE